MAGTNEEEAVWAGYLTRALENLPAFPATSQNQALGGQPAQASTAAGPNPPSAFGATWFGYVDTVMQAEALIIAAADGHIPIFTSARLPKDAIISGAVFIFAEESPAVVGTSASAAAASSGQKHARITDGRHWTDRRTLPGVRGFGLYGEQTAVQAATARGRAKLSKEGKQPRAPRTNGAPLVVASCHNPLTACWPASSPLQPGALVKKTYVVSRMGLNSAGEQVMVKYHLNAYYLPQEVSSGCPWMGQLEMDQDISTWAAYAAQRFRARKGAFARPTPPGEDEAQPAAAQPAVAVLAAQAASQLATAAYKQLTSPPLSRPASQESLQAGPAPADPLPAAVPEMPAEQEGEASQAASEADFEAFLDPALWL